MLFKVPYVIHKHDATHAGLHFDLRMKIPKKRLLASFALPKCKFPKKSGEKVLAVRTPDHGRYWLYYQGEIPKGEYGAGTIKIVQKGEAEIYGWSKKHITFRIEGDVANGKYSLIKFKGKRDKVNTWILVRVKNQSRSVSENFITRKLKELELQDDV